MPGRPKILDVIRHVLILQHPSDLAEVIIRKNANVSTSSMGYSSWRLLHRVTVHRLLRPPF